MSHRYQLHLQDKDTKPQTNWKKYATLYYMTSHIGVIYRHSNTYHLRSQWLNSVINWLTNHCTDWAWRHSAASLIFMTSFITYMYLFCRPLTIWSLIILTFDGVTSNKWTFKTYVKCTFPSKQDLREILMLCSRWQNIYNYVIGWIILLGSSSMGYN